MYMYMRWIIENMCISGCMMGSTRQHIQTLNPLRLTHIQSTAHRLYRSKNQAWLTPVEIFAPHYSNAIARYDTNYDNHACWFCAAPSHSGLQTSWTQTRGTQLSN